MLNIPASKTFQAGDIIFREGDSADCSYFIELGQVEIFLDDNGEEKRLAILTENELFGEMAIIDRFPRSACARAMTSCRVGVIHHAQLRDRLTESDPVVRMLVTVLIKRLRSEVWERLKESEHADRNEDKTEKQPKISLPLHAIQKFKMEGLLRNAIRNGEMDLHYQPIVLLKDQEVVGFEALLRWNNSLGQTLYPDSFISVCEETNLIIPIGRWVIEKALRDLAYIMDATGNNYFVSVNVSGKQIFDPLFFEHLENERKKQGLHPTNIKLEITEQVFVRGDEAMLWISEAHQLGYTLALDDFGTGYSSFQYLGQMALDYIKIDKSFVQGMLSDSKNFMITNAIIQLGKNFGIPTIAEGIEELSQLTQLGGLNCEYGQGYFFQRPIERDGLILFLSKKLKAA